MKILAEYEAEKFLSTYLPVAKSTLVKTDKQWNGIRKKYPAVMKIISKQALHKTDIGGVKIVNTKEEGEQAYEELKIKAKRKKLRLDGILFQEFVKGKEVIIGIKKDPVFGHILAVGIGGVYVEVLKDITFRACPITRQDAEEMIGELKFKQLLFGARKEKPINRKLLVDILVKASKLPEKNKRIEELDINPFIINDKSGKVADARISLS